MKTPLASLLFLSLVITALSACSAEDPATSNTAGTGGAAAGASGAAAGGTSGAAAGGTSGAATGGTAGTATAGAGAGGTAVVAPPFCDAPTTLFQLDGSTGGGCAGDGCHSAGSPFPPDLVSPGVETRLLDVASGALICPGEKYIDSANPDNSLILKKLVDPPSCGAFMPFATMVLQPAQVDCIRGWVHSVATP